MGCGNLLCPVWMPQKFQHQRSGVFGVKLLITLCLTFSDRFTSNISVWTDNNLFMSCLHLLVCTVLSELPLYVLLFWTNFEITVIFLNSNCMKWYQWAANVRVFFFFSFNTDAKRHLRTVKFTHHIIFTDSHSGDCHRVKMIHNVSVRQVGFDSPKEPPISRGSVTDTEVTAVGRRRLSQSRAAVTRPGRVSGETRPYSEALWNITGHISF